VALVQQDLGSDVLWRSANGVGALRNNFGESEVNHLQVAVCANHDVFWLQVTVHHFETLKVLKDGDYLCPVEGRLLGIEVAHAPVVREKVSASQQLSDEVNVLVVLHEPVVFHLQQR